MTDPTSASAVLELLGIPASWLWLFILIAIWDLVWRGLALWKCGRNNQPVWFVFVLIVNSMGILPIIYLAFFQKKSASASVKVKRRK